MKKKTSKKIINDLLSQNSILREQLEKSESKNLEISYLLENAGRENLNYFYLLEFINSGLLVNDFRALIECTIEPDNKVSTQFFKNLEFIFKRLEDVKTKIFERTNIKAEAVGTAPAEI